ncbi:hypothetical protein GCM10011579_007030 [Streptomyces albiflavescens]|uniref:Uncharacterized protein n=1 Tax=Streptomyces albiflavescens TaxID=1623582 RepID=A0A917XTA7_9ACTN|nr:hypothetical protein GCM10011579_007030 [Streptomyces albiflavescens]
MPVPPRGLVDGGRAQDGVGVVRPDDLEPDGQTLFRQPAGHGEGRMTGVARGFGEAVEVVVGFLHRLPVHRDRAAIGAGVGGKAAIVEPAQWRKVLLWSLSAASLSGCLECKRAPRQPT